MRAKVVSLSQCLRGCLLEDKNSGITKTSISSEIYLYALHEAYPYIALELFIITKNGNFSMWANFFNRWKLQRWHYTLIDKFFESERALGHALIAAFIIETQGSTYRKSGALMFFGANGRRCGLLSGGCLEDDLQDHAQKLLDTNGRCTTRTYDSRGSDDDLWGLGLGCEGMMRVLLLRLDPETNYEPVNSLRAASATRQPAAYSINIHTGESILWTDGFAHTNLGADIFNIVAEHIPALLVCGAGPDAEPVVSFAAALGWQVTVIDHRLAYIEATRFQGAKSVLQVDMVAVETQLELNNFDAAVVMSHHLNADRHYLSALSLSNISYIGLLGPAARRERLMSVLNTDAIRNRLYAPIGIEIGARSPESIAISIIAQIQSVLSKNLAHQGTVSPV